MPRKEYRNYKAVEVSLIALIGFCIGFCIGTVVSSLIALT